MDAAGKPQRLEKALHMINLGFYKVLENSEAMPAYLFQIGATLGGRLTVNCPGIVLTAQEERSSCDREGLELLPRAQDGRDMLRMNLKEW